MEQIGNLLKTQIEKESGSYSKLQEKCKVCGQPFYKEYNILGINRVLKIKCKCEIEKYNKEKELEQVREKQLRLENLIKNSLMDKKFRQSTFENWDFNKGTKQMFDLGKRYANNFRNCKEEGLGLLIYGPPGNGKTYTATCVANELLNKFVVVVCVSINGLLSRIQETYNKWGKEAEGDIINGLCNADLLIIDDLGTEKRSDWSKSMIYNVIDSRYRSNLPLIITTNLLINPKETNGILTELYDRRTEDRILEMCTPIMNNQKSIRIDEAKKKTERLRKILYEEEKNE